MCDVDFFHVMTNTSSVFFYPVSPQACYCACVASHSLSIVRIVSSQSPCTTLSHPPFIQMHLLWVLGSYKWCTTLSHSFITCADVLAPTIMTVTPGKTSFLLRGHLLLKDPVSPKWACYCASVTFFKSPHRELYQCLHSLSPLIPPSHSGGWTHKCDSYSWGKLHFSWVVSGHLLLKDPLSPTLSHGLVGVWPQVMFCLLLLVTTPLGGWTQTLLTRAL